MVTVGHDIDCADRVELAEHAVIAGFRSSVLTHSLNFVNDRFFTGTVTLGPYAVLCRTASCSRAPTSRLAQSSRPGRW